mgnify:CR=1 FL=1
MTPRKTDLLPQSGDAYRAFGPHGQTPRRRLHFVTGDYGRKNFDYADLERLRLVRGGDVMTLWFGDTEVTLEGRHLHSLYHSIGLHRLPWAWEHPSPADFAPPNNPNFMRRLPSPQGQSPCSAYASGRLERNADAPD